MNGKRIKLVYAYDTHLSPRWLQNLCLDELQNEFDIEYWDCSAIVNVEYKTSNIITRPYVVIIDGFDKLKYNLQRLPKDALIINGIHKSTGSKDFKIHKIISRFTDTCVIIWCFSADDVTNLKLSPSTLCKKLIEAVSTGTFFSKVKGKIMHHKYEKMYKNYRIACLMSEETMYRINHPDYERYKKSLSKITPFAGERYVVYIDNNFPFHTDIVIREPYLKPAEMAPKFYASLNGFFDRVEKKYNCKVKIAGHPIAIYKNNPYGGREIIYDKTPELIKDCLAACIHTSNAFSYIILYDKPVAMISNSVYKTAKIEYGRLTREAEALKMPITDTDAELPADDSLFRRVDADIAQKYKNKYLIADSNKSNVELYAKYFREIYEERNKRI